MADHKKKDEVEIPVGETVRIMKRNPWIIASIVLAVVAIVLAIMVFNSAGAVSSKKAGENLINFVETQTGYQASIVSITKQDGVYQAVVDLNGQNVPVYVSLDGNYLISDLIPLSGSATTTTPTSTSDVSKVIIDSDTPVLGSSNAKVTVIEFSDFSCPFCAAASGDNPDMTAYMKQNNPNWEPIVTNLIKDYVNTGKVRLAVFYSMGHSGGHPAQLVAWCLNEQELYWKFYAKAYAVNPQTDVEDLEKMKTLAKSVGANMNKLQSCLDSGKYDSRFAEEQSMGAQAGVQGTPAFFVNDQLVSGAVPYSQIKSIIDAELAK